LVVVVGKCESSPEAEQRLIQVRNQTYFYIL
jgi:hypothetical protein